VPPGKVQLETLFVMLKSANYQLLSRQTNLKINFERSISTMAAEMAKVEEELIINTSTGLEVPADILAKAKAFNESYVASLKARTEEYVKRATNGVRPRAGEPVLVGGYKYWDCLTVGPIQFIGDPPYQPSKVIAFGEFALIQGIIWVNPLNGPGGSLPGTTVLGGRSYRARFETINLSTVTDGPDFLTFDTFSPIAPIVTVINWFFVPNDPGPNPQLYETTLTVDITNSGQPFAAFSNWHIDPDSDPPFLGIPGVGPQLQLDIPMKYLVYRKF
jgi:hypothetical protein